MAFRPLLPGTGGQLEIELAMAFTDIFIKRPVLSVVVSLLILLIGLRAAMVRCRSGNIRTCPTPS